MFKFVPVGSRRVGYARPAGELIPAFVGAGHARPAINELRVRSMKGVEAPRGLARRGRVLLPHSRNRGFNQMLEYIHVDVLKLLDVQT